MSIKSDQKRGAADGIGSLLEIGLIMCMQVSGRRGSPILMGVFFYCIWLALVSAGIEVVLVQRAQAESFDMGSGVGRVVFYDERYNVQQEFKGWESIADCRSAPDDTFVVAQVSKRQVVRVDRGGRVLNTWVVSAPPRQIRINNQLDLLAVSEQGIEVIRQDGATALKVNLQEITDAEFNPQGGYILTRMTPEPFLGYMEASGAVEWRTPSRAQDVKSPSGLLTVSANETGDFAFSDGRYLTAHFAGQSSPVRHDLASVTWLARGRIGSDRRLLFFDREGLRLGFFDREGNRSTYSTQMLPVCVDSDARGGLMVGFVPRPLGQLLGREQNTKYLSVSTSWTRQSLATGIMGAVGLAVLLIFFHRRYRGRTYREGRDPRGVACAPFGDGQQDRQGSLQRGVAYYFRLLGCFCGIAAGVYGLFRGITALHPALFVTWGLWLLVGAIFVVVSLIGLVRLHGVAPLATKNIEASSNESFSWMLFLLSLCSLVGCLIEQYVHGDNRLSISAWFVAQTLFIASIVSGNSRISGRASWRHTSLLLLVLLLAAGSRLWEIGNFPDTIHHDHGIIGQSALRFFLGDWSPFFVLDPLSGGMMRPWLIPMSSSLYFFGEHYWVLRLSSALWFVVLVYGCFKLGAVLSSTRLGLIFAALVVVHHTLLLYSRQPYVIEATPPFILSLYFLAAGLRSSALKPWGLAGLWVGYSMLSIRSCTQYPGIWIALFIWCCLAMPALIVRRGRGLLLMVIGIVIVGAPFVQSYIASSRLLLSRLSETSVLFGPGFTIKGDGALWAHQFGRSFGSFFVFRDAGPWGITTSAPLFMGLGVGLFCIGLVYMLLYPRRLLTGFILVPTAACLTLGSAMLIDPPGYYHIFPAIVLSLCVVAVPIERLWSLAATAKNKILSLVFLTAAVLALGIFSYNNVAEFWRAVRRPSPPYGNLPFWSPTSQEVVARAVGEMKPERVFIVRKAEGLTASDAHFFFVGFRSDIRDITYDLADQLPLSPSADKGDVLFVVLPERAGAEESIREVYPRAQLSRIAFGTAAQTISTLLVSHAEIDEAFRAGRKLFSSNHAIYYQLTPLR